MREKKNFFHQLFLKLTGKIGLGNKMKYSERKSCWAHTWGGSAPCDRVAITNWWILPPDEASSVV